MTKLSYTEKAQIIIESLGGKDNITSFMTCATRLRIELVDINKLQENPIKEVGAYYIIRLGGGAIQIIWGPTANIMEEEMKALMKNM